MSQPTDHHSAHADFARAEVNWITNLISKWPVMIISVMYSYMLLAAVLGGGNITVTFGPPGGRSPYSPTDVNETRRLDYVILAQREVTVKSDSAEQQTTAYPGFSMFFEEVDAQGGPALDEPIFTEENLQIMLEAQEIITKAPGYEDVCQKCAVEESLFCTRSKSAKRAAENLQESLVGNFTESDVESSAKKAVQKTSSLCDALSDTCSLKTSAKAIEEAIDDGALDTDAGVDGLRADADSLVFRLTLTKEGTCSQIPGCEDASESKPLCAPFYSPLTYFYDDDGNLRNLGQGFRSLQGEIDTPDSEEILSRKSIYPASYYLPAYYEEGTLRAHTTRLTHFMGIPIEGYTDSNDRTEEQEAFIDAFLIALIPALEDFRLKYADKLTFRWLAAGEVLNAYFSSLLGRDVTLAGGAVVAVFAYLLYHTGLSFFISFLTLVGVVLCFPVGTFWTILVFQITFFDPLNLFLLFILLGLGADGAFIVFDAWNQSRDGLDVWKEMHGEEEAIKYRMAYVWNRSAKAMLACNGTTVLAFIAVIPSPIMPTSAFGVLSAIVISHNLVLDITVVPALLLLWERNFHGKCCFCFKHLPKWCACFGGTSRAKANDGALAASGSATSMTRTEAFYLNVFAPWLLRWRRVILGVSLCIVAIFAWQASTLEPDTESPQFLPDDNPTWQAILSVRDGWLEGDSDVRSELWMVWGINGSDQSNFTKYQFATPACDNSTCGEVIWDDTFDPSPKKMQEYLLDSCEEAAKIEAGLGPEEGEFIYDEEVAECLMKDFRGWLSGKGEDFPVEDKDDFWELLHEYLQEPDEDEDIPAGEGYEFVRKKLTKLGSNGAQRMFFLIRCARPPQPPANGGWPRARAAHHVPGPLPRLQCRLHLGQSLHLLRLPADHSRPRRLPRV